MTSKPKVKVNQRLDDFPNEGFAILDGNLYCNFCDCHVSWLHKSDVLKHIATAKHGNAKKRSLPNESVSVSSGDGTSTSAQSTVTSRPNAAKRQRTMGEMVSATINLYVTADSRCQMNRLKCYILQRGMVT
jgi:hypothetical protein